MKFETAFLVAVVAIPSGIMSFGNPPTLVGSISSSGRIGIPQFL